MREVVLAEREKPSSIWQERLCHVVPLLEHLSFLRTPGPMGGGALGRAPVLEKDERRPTPPPLERPPLGIDGKVTRGAVEQRPTSAVRIRPSTAKPKFAGKTPFGKEEESTSVIEKALRDIKSV